MVKPSDQSKRAHPRQESAPARTRRARAKRAAASHATKRGPKPSRTDGLNTRALVLEATWRRLATHGYGNLNLRDIAREAGVNHALINYHFRSKQALVLEVLDDMNRRLLERQKTMYATPLTVADKWQQACDFYEDDLRSGFVRVLIELLAASFSDEELRRDYLPRMLEWFRVVEDAVIETADKYQLDLPASSRVIATWIGGFWWGMEAVMTAGVTEEQMPFREALQAVGKLLRSLEEKRTNDGDRTKRDRKSAAKASKRRQP